MPGVRPPVVHEARAYQPRAAEVPQAPGTCHGTQVGPGRNPAAVAPPGRLSPWICIPTGPQG